MVFREQVGHLLIELSEVTSRLEFRGAISCEVSQNSDTNPKEESHNRRERKHNARCAPNRRLLQLAPV